MSFIGASLATLCGCGPEEVPLAEDPANVANIFPQLSTQEHIDIDRAHFCLVVRRKREMWLKLCVPAVAAARR